AAARRRPAPEKAPVPAISVGNVVVGGAGKTPIVLEIARRLLARGRRVAVLSRGYGRRGRGDAVVREGTPEREAGDEPLLLKRRLPQAAALVGRRRTDRA